ncbi:MAG: UDP-N-acetylmuramate dehydrogenase [Eubacteriales bacterium]|nr:UDP-N-acetylmuramate dehydrogenase [Eubacteriales bacterium]
MTDNHFYEILCGVVGERNVLRDEPMKKHTTFRVGGPARYFCTPESAGQLSRTLKACREAGEPYYILGNGSNMLVSDEGYEGTIIRIFHNMDDIRIEGRRMEIGAGALLVKAAHAAAKAGLTGLEFASGIPGTLGGALVMNAGAYGGEMKDVVREALVMDQSGELLRLSAEELEMGYRTSVVARRGYVALGASLELQRGDPAAIEARMQELREARTSKQPLEYASAGSTFKRPDGYFAGKLIEDADLRGFRIGDAQVSEKHCGFVINRGEATAAQVRELIRQVQERVYAQTGVRLEPEVRFLGFEKKEGDR